MEQFYFVCALFGGTLFVCQFALSLLGIANHHDLVFGQAGDHDAGIGDHDVAHDAAASWFVGVLTFRTIVAGLTIFGLAGLASHAGGASPVGSVAVATVCGFVALYSVAWIMRILGRLRSDGTVRIQNAVGQCARVYLTIPSQRSGVGKVTVNIQNRTMEYAAQTDQGELPTGTVVTITSVTGPETVVVEPAPDPLPISCP